MDLFGIHFADPDWLLGIILVPFALAAALLLSRARHSTLSVGNPRLVEGASGFFSPHLVPWFLKALALCLCLVAAARPQEGKKKVEEKKPVTDLMVALDVSGSMITNDLKPNRITAAKKLLSEFLDKVQNARVGLTIFARISFTQCPLTTDVQVVKQLLANVEPAPYSIKLDGTAIGDALVSCLNRLKQGTDKSADADSSSSSLASRLFHSGSAPVSAQQGGGQDNSNKAILLMTDGSNNFGLDPFTAAKIAAAEGVKIYAIGMGSSHSVPALYLYPDGHWAPAIDPSTGQVAMSPPVDMLTLREIAQITGGKAYAATDNKALKAVLDDVARLEKRDVTVTSHWEYNELAPLFLLAAFLILVLDVSLETTALRTLP